MKRRWKIAIAAVALFTSVAAIVLTTDNSEPEYKGRTLSEWISAYQEVHEGPPGTENGRSSEAAQSLRAVAPQIFPTLIRWISYDKSAQMARVENFIWPVAKKLGLGTKYTSFTQKREHRASAALAAFDALGTNAIPAFPKLSNIVMNANTEDCAFHAQLALVYAGKEGAKTIVALLNNPDNPHLVASIVAASQCDTKDLPLIRPEVQKLLTHTNQYVRAAAADVLKDIQ